MKKAQAKYSIASAWSRDQLYCGHVTKPGRSRDQASRSRDWSHDNRRGHMTFPTFFTHRHIASWNLTCANLYRYINIPIVNQCTNYNTSLSTFTNLSANNVSLSVANASTF